MTPNERSVPFISCSARDFIPGGGFLVLLSLLMSCAEVWLVTVGWLVAGEIGRGY